MSGQNKKSKAKSTATSPGKNSRAGLRKKPQVSSSAKDIPTTPPSMQVNDDEQNESGEDLESSGNKSDDSDFPGNSDSSESEGSEDHVDLPVEQRPITVPARFKLKLLSAEAAAQLTPEDLTAYNERLIVMAQEAAAAAEKSRNAATKIQKKDATVKRQRVADLAQARQEGFDAVNADQNSGSPEEDGELSSTELLVQTLQKVVAQPDRQFISANCNPIDTLDEATLTTVEGNLLRADHDPRTRQLGRFFSQKLQGFLDLMLEASPEEGEVSAVNPALAWRLWSNEKIVLTLRHLIRNQEKSTENTSMQPVVTVLIGVFKQFKGLRQDQTTSNLNWLSAVNSTVIDMIQDGVRENTAKSVMHVIRQLLTTHVKSHPLGRGVMHQVEAYDRADWSWSAWYASIIAEYKIGVAILERAKAYQERPKEDVNTETPVPDAPGKGQKRNLDQGTTPTAKANKKSSRSGGGGGGNPNTSRLPCKGCGRGPGACKGQPCRFSKHPDYNHENRAWGESTNGKAWKNHKSFKSTCLPVLKCLDPSKEAEWAKICPKAPGEYMSGDTMPHSYVPSMLNAMLPVHKEDKFMLCQPCTVKHTDDVIHDVDNIFSEADCNGMRVMTLVNHNDSTLSNVRLKVLFDTGALGKATNYISREAAKKLKAAGYKPYRTNKTVCSCFVGSFKLIDQFFKLKLRFFDDTVKTHRTLTLKCDVIDTPHDVIIGFDTIKRCRALRDVVISGFVNTSLSSISVTDGNEVRYEGVDDEILDTETQMRNSGVRDSGEFGISYPEDEDNWNPYDAMSTLNSIHEIQPEIYLPPKVISGTDKLIKLLTKICKDQQELKKVFSKELNKEPAKITPMRLELEGDWLSRENQLPPRMVSFLKGVEIVNQTTKMSTSGVIGESRAPAHSQVMLTVKPDGSWRFCIDFRRLNAVTKSNNWPLPKIKEMLERLGRTKSKWFGVIDLTKGYYQAPLHQDSQHLTAFITPDGLWEWKRVPMGLKGAGAYFQRAMATEVLSDLLYTRCEVYLDDIIIYGRTEEEFAENLKAVLARLGDHNITVNPDKCRLGLREIEYVGHLISEAGCHFTREKLQKVVEVALPVKSQELKSFLGLTNYFRENVRNYAAVTQPLQTMLHDYNPRKVLEWDPGTRQAFEETKRLVNECPMLFWMDTDQKSEIHLYTDASKLGIGAYLCQRREDGKEYPIAFFSKTLNGAEKNWGVPELEGYAIYAAFKQFDYLLRDVHTHVHTDHKNLTYIRDTGSEKVIRWKMHLQEYSFDLAYVPGPENPIADFFSRNEAAEVDTYKVETPIKFANMLASMATTESGIHWESGITYHSKSVCNECNASWDTWRIPDDRYADIKAVHDCVAGHHGVEATLDKLTRKGLKWPGMREHVRRYIKECDTCQKHSYRQFDIKVPKFVTGRYHPMEKLGIDTIGPLPKDADGNEHVVVIIDMFTRFVALYPVKSTSAEDAADALLQHVGHYGVPAELQSDKGSQYVTEIITEFLEMVGTEHVIGLAYSKEEQGIVERSNGKIGKWVRDLLYDKKLEKTLWSKYLPFVQRLHNASKVHSTGFAPCQILFGDQVVLDRSILLPQDCRNDPADKDLSEWMKSRRNMQERIIEAAQALHHEHAEQTEFENMVVNDHTEFPDNSYVLMSYPTSGFGPSKPSKLHMMHKGPYRVISHEGQNYKLMNLVTDKVEWKVIHLLRPFYYDTERTNPVDVAQRDFFDEFEIEEVLSHTGKRSRKSSLEFKIKWLGYADITIEPWAHVRLHSVLHEYLKEHGMENLIPKDLDPVTKAKTKRAKATIAKAKATKAVRKAKVRSRAQRAERRDIST